VVISGPLTMHSYLKRCFLCCRLEYKYCKLVESAGGREGELPGVESCAMEEGEEEDVHFADQGGPKLLQKIRLKISSIKNKVSHSCGVFMLVCV
jgi:hypothetical protein